MNITHHLDMDLIRPGVAGVVRGVQGEAGSRVLCFHLTQNGTAWSIPEEAAATVRYRKADGTGGIYDTLPNGDPACSISANALSVILAPQVTACPGLGELQAVLTLEDKILSTFTVYLQILEDPSASAEPSEDYFNWLSATREALEEYMKTHPLPGGLAVPQTEQALQALLDAGIPARLDSTLVLSQSILVRKNNAHLEFSPTGRLDIRGKTFPAIHVLRTESGTKPENVVLKDVQVQGDGLAGSCGVYLEAIGPHSRLENLTVYCCEKGIATGEYGCAERISIHGLHLLQCGTGVEDTAGGLDKSIVCFGCIEGSLLHGLVTAAGQLRLVYLNLRDSGSTAVKLLNAPNPDGDTCCQVQLMGGIVNQPGGDQLRGCFQLGDSTQDNGWFGHLSLTGVNVALNGNFLAMCLGDALPEDGESFHGSRDKQLTVTGCVFDAEPACFLPDTQATLTRDGLPWLTEAEDGKLLQAQGGKFLAVSVADSAIATYIDDYINTALGGDY